MNQKENNLEIEYKYWAGDLTMEEFHDRVENSNAGKKVEPFYVVSCDDYYIRDGSHNDFVRYRKGGGKTELTLKFKRKQNTVRKEINLDVSENDDMSIVEFLKLSGYHKAFSVFKEAWIYKIDHGSFHCDLSFYTLSDGRSVVEVEAINPVTVDDGIEIIDWWAKQLGLADLEREKRSLFEIFTDEMSEISN